ncbi:MAG: CBS domain-containing protein [bacterium]
MLVHDWMTEHPITATPDSRISSVVAEMARHHVRHVPVVRPDPAGAILVGIVSTYDVARAYPREINPWGNARLPAGLDRPVADVMTPDPITVEPSTPIERAAHELVSRRIHALPVVRAGRLVGMITGNDVTRAFVALLGPRSQGVRITFALATHEDVFGTVVALAKQHQVELGSVVTAHHGGHRIAVVQVTGPQTPAFLDGIWASGHRVESVVYDEPVAA